MESNFVRRFTEGFYPDISSLLIIDKLTYSGKISNIERCLGDSRVKFVEGDICDLQLVEKLMLNCDVVINFAAETHVDRSISNSFEFVHTNVLGVQNLLNVAMRINLKKFLQISTDEVYGSAREGSWDENAPLLPNSPYSASKASADLLVRSYNVTHNLFTIITRCSNNYGPYQFPEKFIPHSIMKVLAGSEIEIYGNGLNIRDWLHVDDHCDGIYIALTRGSAGEIYNIGGGTEKTNFELASEINKILGMGIENLKFVPDRKGHDFRYSVDDTKIRKLGYRPSRNFNESLIETVNWYKENL